MSFPPPLLASFLPFRSERIASVGPLFNIVQISGGSRSPTLSNKIKYPLFFRTNSGAGSVAPAFIRFCKHYKWARVGFVTETESVAAGTLLTSVVEATQQLIKDSGAKDG